MNRDSSQQVIGILILFFAAGLFFSFYDVSRERVGGYEDRQRSQEVRAQRKGNFGTGTASLTLSYQEGVARRFEGLVIENMTILDALNSASSGGGFDVRYSFELSGDVNLRAIDGQIANDIKKWHLRLNGLEIDAKDIGRIRIKKYDSIEARFE